MSPEIFKIGPMSIRWYGVLILAGVILGLFLAGREAKRQEMRIEVIYDLFYYMLISAIVGARLYYVIFSWDLYRNNLGGIIAFWHGGLAIHGAIIGGTFSALIYTRLKGISFWKVADCCAPSLILGQAIGRWGNFFNQEAYGRPTDLPWGIFIDEAHRPFRYIQQTHFHPTFLYESLWDFCVFLFLLWGRRKKGIIPGDVFLAYLMLYSLGRFWIEGLRMDSLMFAGFRVAQIVSLFLILCSSIILIQHRRGRQ
ncbi:MAG: prolipoprotein diacylglyceryl transferase [Syntrophobacterales bacterium]|nr:MAG: prolipoprotein diacylglyceryl transferase [Syntrophobacterales bacterium]